MVTELEADLYSIGGTALVVTDGFAFRATNDACVKIVDGKIVATKFGLERTGPDFVRKTREEAEEYGLELYDRIKKGVTLELYYSQKYYIPTKLDRVFERNDKYALYDTETDYIYRPEFDSIDSTYNLVGVSTNTVQKVNDLDSKIKERYIPLIGIDN